LKNAQHIRLQFLGRETLNFLFALDGLLNKLASILSPVLQSALRRNVLLLRFAALHRFRPLLPLPKCLSVAAFLRRSAETHEYIVVLLNYRLLGSVTFCLETVIVVIGGVCCQLASSHQSNFSPFGRPCRRRSDRSEVPLIASFVESRSFLSAVLDVAERAPRDRLCLLFGKVHLDKEGVTWYVDW